MGLPEGAVDHGSTVTPITDAAKLAELASLRDQIGEAGGFPPTPEMKVTHEEMKKARVPLNFRDYCAHILIPLNECRVKTWYSPYKCGDLRHEYEKCQHEEYERRVRIAQILKSGGGADE